MNAIEELIERTHHYAWGEMTLTERKELRDRAAAELAAKEARIAELEQWMKKAYEWFEDNDSISVNSSAYKELADMIKSQKEK